MEAKRDSRAARDEVLALRARAPIAGQFEDCVQVFDKLASALEACRRGIDEWFNKRQHPGAKQQLRDTFTLLDEAVTKFKTWDRDLGASSRSLDHALRGSDRMTTQTLALLEELHEVLIKGIEKIPPRYWDLPSEPDLLPLPDEGNLTMVDQESDEEADKFIEDALDIVGCLYDLQDDLYCPGEDWETAEVSDEEAKTYAELASMMFPHAPPYFVERLIASSARRRQRIKLLNNSGTRSRSHSNQLSVPIPRNSLATGTRALGRRRFKRGFAASDAGQSTAMSNFESIFSAGTFPSTTGDSSIDVFSDFLRTSVKPPRMPAELVRGRTCNCRFCGFQLPFASYQEDEQEVRMSVDDWEQHIYQDLQPYMCTFENCYQPQQSFGLLTEWFRHETFEHRSEDVWRCGGRSCQIEFDSQHDYEQHLRASHGDLLQARDLDALARDSKHLALPSSRGHHCIVCGAVVSDVQDLKVHIGTHMELFALASMQVMEYTSSEDEGDAEVDEILYEELHPVMTEFIIHQEINSPDSDYRPYRPEPGRLLPGWDAARAQMSSKTGGRVNTGVSDVDVASDSSLSEEKGWVEDEDERVQTMKVQERHNRVQSFLEKRPVASEVSDQWTPDMTTWSNMPIRNTDFIGRESDLRRVHDVLAVPGQLCILSGRGGVGKTASAVEYCFQYEKHYRYIFWVEAENTGSCAEKFALIAAQMWQVDVSKQSQAALIGMVQEHLSQTELRWLLIFDNVECMRGLEPYLPRKLGRTQGSVLVTTRENDMPDRAISQFQEVCLQELSIHDSTHLLLRSMQPDSRRSDEFDPQQHPDYEAAVEASRLVGRLPLAIGMIAGYVKASRASLDTFLDIWEEQEERHGAPKTQESGGQAGGINDSIDKLWDIGISELMMKARNFLDILSFLNPEAIQKDLLVSDHQDQSLDFPNPREKIRYKHMIDQLTGRKLISVKKLDDGTEVYSIHRLLQQKIIADMTIPDFSEAFQRVYGMVRRKYPHSSKTQIPEPDNWAACGRYMPHVFSLHHIYKEIGHVKETEGLAELFYDAGFHVWERDTTAYDGVGFLTSALAILDKLSVDGNAKLRADIHSIMGEFYSGRGAMWRAESVAEHSKALVIRQKAYDASPDDKTTDVLLRNATNDLACCLLSQNRFEEAALAFQLCFKQYKVWDSEEAIPFEYQKYYSNYGLVQTWRGNYEEAIAALRRSTELSRMHSTKTWHYCMNNFSLGCALLQSGDIQGALDTHLETLKVRADLYGKHEAATIISSYAVGATYHQLDDPHSAFEYFRECIDCAKTASRLPEEAYGKMLHHLSVIQRELGLKDDAEKAEAKALAILDKFKDYIAPCVKETGDEMMMFDDLQALFEGRWTGTKLLKHMQTCALCKEKAEAVVNYPGRQASPTRSDE